MTLIFSDFFMRRQTAHSDLSQLEKMLQVKTFAEVEMSESAPTQLVDLGGRSVEVWQDEVEYKSDQTRKDQPQQIG